MATGFTTRSDIGPARAAEGDNLNDSNYNEFTGYGGQQTIRMGDWKAVRQNLGKGRIRTELYNIATDISEKNDVAAEHPDVVAKLESMMAEQHTPSDVFPLKALDVR